MKSANKQWGEFKVRNLFNFEKHKSIDVNKTIKGSSKLIGLTGFNNGIRKYIKIPSNQQINKPNCITVTLDGSPGTSFFQDQKFITTQNVHVLRLKIDISKFNTASIYLFLSSILRTLKTKYFYARKLTKSSLENEKIMLPVDNDNQPDWEFMEKYIKYRAEKIVFQQKKLVNFEQTKFVQNKIWKEFKINGLFEIKVGGDNKNLNNNDYSKNKINIISNTSSNNGIVRFICNDKINIKPSITIATRGNDWKSYYQENNSITVVRNIQLTSKSFRLNYLTGLFLCAVFKTNSRYYSYGRFLSGQKIQKETIMLPVDNNNQPDWEFMEEYIKERATQILF